MIGGRLVAVAAAVVGTAGLVGCASSHPAGSAAAKQYLTIAQAGNTRLDKDFDGLDDADSLAAARADLLDAAATERRFDTSLQALTLPAGLQPTVRALVGANEARAALAAFAAQAATLAGLRSYQVGLDALNDPVEDQVTALRHALGLPPPDTDS